MRSRDSHVIKQGAEAENERRLRSKNKTKRTMGKSEFSVWEKKSGGKNGRPRSNNITIISDSDDEVNFEFIKPLWMRFEDRVWTMFHEIGIEGQMSLPEGDTTLNYDGANTKQIDGLYSDSEYVYVVECKYRATEGGKNHPPGLISQEMRSWAGIWKPICKKLERMDEYKGKKPVFILATRGIVWNDKLKKTLSQFDGILLDDSKISGMIKLSNNFSSRSTMAMFRQEIFRESEKHRTLPGIKSVFPATKTTIDGFRIYQFFAKADSLIHLSHVPRRMPTGGDISSAYQRNLKHAKVNSIGKYLSQRGAFFPNSIVVATESSPTWYKSGGDDVSEFGKIEIPNEYGCLFIIDGQHRLYGTEGSADSVKNSKPLSICLIEGLGQTNQAQLFTTINQTQSKVDPDLLWDLYGELGSVDPAPDPDVLSEVNQTIMFLISKVWKRINQAKDHPMQGVIKIPSHPSSSKSKISFGNTLCKYLFMRKGNWNQGYLRPSSWIGAENYAYKRVAYFYKSLLLNLEKEWTKEDKKEDKNWLRTNYSLIVITIVFNHMVSFYGGNDRFKRDWQTTGFVSLIDEFTDLLGKAILSPENGFSNKAEKRNILKAGNSGLRSEFARDLVLHIKENGGIKFREFAPFITEEEEGEYPSQKTKKRAERVENRLRALIFYKMSETHGTKWKGKLPPSVNIYIDEAMQSRRAMGHDYEDPPTIEVLNEITTYHILIILKAQKNHKIDFFLTKDGDGVFQVRDAEFTTRWRDFSNLRNLIAHHNSYPSEEMKSLMEGALGLMEKWLDAAEGN